MIGWIMDQIDAILGLGDLAIVVVLGTVVVAIPVGILAAYAIQRLRSLG